MSRFSRSAVVLLVNLAWLPAPSARGQGPGALQLPAEARTRLVGAILGEMERQEIPGLSVAIVAGGRLRWVQGFGKADLENDVPATARTVYRLASISKPFTAVAAMQLVERGKLDLDAPVQSYVPEFPEKKWPVTTRQLLAHLGGVRHYRGDENFSTKKYRDLFSPLAIFKDDPLVFEPGTRFHYSSYGFNLAGCVVERAAGQPFMEYLRDNVFEPAGIETLRDDDSEAIIPRRAQGYRRTNEGEIVNSRPADTSNKIPGGGMCGTVIDLARFAIALQGQALLRAPTREAMYSPQETTSGEVLSYALGWHATHRPGRREIWHGGGQPRVSTMLYTRPDHRTAVILMTNLEGAKLLELSRELADMVSEQDFLPRSMSSDRPDRPRRRPPRPRPQPESDSRPESQPGPSPAPPTR